MRINQSLGGARVPLATYAYIKWRHAHLSVSLASEGAAAAARTDRPVRGRPAVRWAAIASCDMVAGCARRVFVSVASTYPTQYVFFRRIFMLFLYAFGFYSLICVMFVRNRAPAHRACIFIWRIVRARAWACVHACTVLIKGNNGPCSPHTDSHHAFIVRACVHGTRTCGISVPMFTPHACTATPVRQKINIYILVICVNAIDCSCVYVVMRECAYERTYTLVFVRKSNTHATATYNTYLPRFGLGTSDVRTRFSYIYSRTAEPNIRVCLRLPFKPWRMIN